MVSANAQIGVAEAAYYPTLSIDSQGGFESSSASNGSPRWADSGPPGLTYLRRFLTAARRKAQVEQARAVYDTDVAAYRQTVLAGFQEVEDNVAAQRILGTEAQAQDEAVQAAQQSLAVTMNQYQSGIVSYLNVVVAQTTALANERTAVDILGRRLTASVLLIKALGGGWKLLRN